MKPSTRPRSAGGARCAASGTATCGTTCALNSLAPNSYVVITGTYTYTPIAPHLSKIVSTTLTEQATVAVR